MMDGDPSAVQNYSGVQTFVADWYGVITSFSWGVMVPLFVAVLIGSLLLSKSAKQNKSSKIRNDIGIQSASAVLLFLRQMKKQ